MDRTIKGPGADRPAKGKVPGVRERREAATAALLATVEQSVAEAANELAIDHRRVMRVLLEVAENPFEQGSARVSAAKELGEIIGTKRSVGDTPHPHSALKTIPEETLAARLARLCGATA